MKRRGLTYVLFHIKYTVKSPFAALLCSVTFFIVYLTNYPGKIKLFVKECMYSGQIIPFWDYVFIDCYYDFKPFFSLPCWILCKHESKLSGERELILQMLFAIWHVFYVYYSSSCLPLTGFIMDHDCCSFVMFTFDYYMHDILFTNVKVCVYNAWNIFGGTFWLVWPYLKSDFTASSHRLDCC